MDTPPLTPPPPFPPLTPQDSMDIVEKVAEYVVVDPADSISDDDDDDDGVLQLESVNCAFSFFLPLFLFSSTPLISSSSSCSSSLNCVRIVFLWKIHPPATSLFVCVCVCVSSKIISSSWSYFLCFFDVTLTLLTPFSTIRRHRCFRAIKFEKFCTHTRARARAQDKEAVGCSVSSSLAILKFCPLPEYILSIRFKNETRAYHIRFYRFSNDNLLIVYQSK